MNKKGTKTEKFRAVVLSATVKSMLLERYERVKQQPDDRVFPAVKGGSMNDQYFRARVWQLILSICNIDYTRPYNIRHSATSHAHQKKGADLAALAEQTGHSKRVLITYLHGTDRECLFVDFGEPEE